MDLFEADAATRTVREVARSDGNVLYWIVGEDQRLAARVRQLGPQDGADVALEVLEPGGGWRALRTIGGWDFLSVHRFDPARRKAWGFSNVGRDKSALVEIDTGTGAERVLASHPVVDLSFAYYTRFAPGPVASLAEPGHPAVEYLDAALGAEVARAVQRARAEGAIAETPRATVPQSSSEDGRRWVLRVRGDQEDAELLLDRTSGAVTRLDPPQAEARALLSPEQPYSFQASDGRTLHGYVIRPRGVEGPAPLVVMIHGGPTARDRWNPAVFNGEQMLANRGYAVLSINYRGSSGYGREYMLAARHEYFGRLQQDIAEAAAWAVAQGIADPGAMAVAGASFGGYSVLSQLIQKRQDWRCGVNWVGVANWPRVVENWPPYWHYRHYTEYLLGDPKKPEDRERMLRQSPITYIDQITAPLLVIQGANDVRVMRQDSEDVVEGLRKLGRPVEYLSFDNEGHSVRRWRNRLEMWRRVEDTLASCLGGRSAGWDFYQLMPR
jgi:dipeptidyl aminopeptidase/acylaminoacyl peptidase